MLKHNKGFIEISIDTGERTELVDITEYVNQKIKESGIEEGICCVYVPHTTAGVTINENADPSVKHDIIETLNLLVPYRGNYTHMEGNSDAHIKASLIGASISIPFSKSRLVLGTWQSVFFCEFDGPRRRKINIKLVAD